MGIFQKVMSGLSARPPQTAIQQPPSADASGAGGVASPPDDYAEGSRAGALLDLRQLFKSDDRASWENNCRRLLFNARLTGTDILCRVLGRYAFVVDASDVGLAPHLIASGFWEIWITRFIANAIQPGMVCLDAGANVGYYSVLMADLAGTNGRVVAVEPIPPTFNLLRRNVIHNGYGATTEVVNAALGASAGEVVLIVPRGEPKNAAIGDVGQKSIENGDYRRYAASRMAIDDLNLPRLDFVKIDVEGSEEAIWDGMQQTIARCPGIQIVMEVNCFRYASPEAFLDKIEGRFPLRMIDYLGNAVAVQRQEVLDSPVDVMLYLCSADGDKAPEAEG